MASQIEYAIINCASLNISPDFIIKKGCGSLYCHNRVQWRPSKNYFNSGKAPYQVNRDHIPFTEQITHSFHLTRKDGESITRRYYQL